MITAICLALVILPVSAITWGAFQGVFDQDYPDISAELDFDGNEYFIKGE